jgi:hypothetical protein
LGARLDDAPVLENTIGLEHRGNADRELAAEPADRRDSLSGQQGAPADQAGDAVRDPAIERLIG